MNHYPEIENEVPKRATYFVSFWWALLWKESLALGGAYGLWALASGWFGLWWRVALLVFIAGALYFFLREVFYAMLEKRYLRKRFTMIAVDKNGNFSQQKLEQTRALIWSFVGGHLLVISWVVSLCALWAGGFWLAADIPFGSLFWETLRALTGREALIMWALVFAIYPHYHLWSRPFFNLAGFRWALISQ